MPDAKPMGEKRAQELELPAWIDEDANATGVRWEMMREVRRLKEREKVLVKSLAWALEGINAYHYDKDVEESRCNFCRRWECQRHKPNCPYYAAKEALEALERRSCDVWIQDAATGWVLGKAK